MSQKNKNLSVSLNYIENCFILSSVITGSVSIPAFAS